MTTFANLADKKVAVLEEMKRVLKKEGKIVLSVFSENALEERMKVYKALQLKIRKIEGGTVYFDLDNEDCVSEQFSKSQLTTIFSSTGLKIEDIKELEIAYLCTLSLA